MKLIITKKEDLEDTIYYLASEVLSKYEALNPGLISTIEEYNFEEFIGDNPFVYLSQLDVDGNICIEELGKYKRVILLANGPKYQDLLKKIFTEEKSDELKATYLFDLEDIYIVTDEIGAKKIPKEE